MSASDLIVSSTGTITLEAGLIGTPLISIYKLSPLSHWLAKKIIGQRFPKYMAFPNLISNKLISPEHLQDEAEPQFLAARVTELLKNTEQLIQIRIAFAALKARLTRPDVLKKNAEAILTLLP